MEVLRKAFTQKLDSQISDFVNCVDDDKAFIEVDIDGSIAHSQMLAQQGLVTPEQAANLKSGLQKLKRSYAEGTLELKPAFEDVHMNVEKQLEVLIGPDALRLHTARSRNDQVATDLRLFVRQAIRDNVKLVGQLQQTLVQLAASNLDAVMPGYTHLQRAQPVLFSHAIMAFVAMLERDKGRFNDAHNRTDESPLGAGALSGSSLPIDPEYTRELLGFASKFGNSIDAITCRDFIVEYLSACATISIHISQIAETLILWNTSEFSFITLGDNVTTSSSLMPNKKNPDPLEIARAKSGTACGDLINVLMILKSLPLGYNRDLQDTKPPLVRTTSAVQSTLRAVNTVVESVTINKESMSAAASDPSIIATDLVEYLVNKGIAFRTAHEQIAALMAHCRQEQTHPNNLSLDKLQSYAPALDANAFALFDPKVSANSKSSAGGTAGKQVAAAIQSWKSKNMPNQVPLTLT